ncbi:TPA_asm: maturation protein [ssRNA phage Gerhypos.2_17]|uniref:Maturation protein n=2 Tax=Leviviricetes TaxID=2842243 RepID=A0A8S5L2F2_9VIRU|nr:maturation protein [ssRNA phage Gerhypos.2_17]DAD51596.1 TPA_asm: maturation protein [ssRNA phage Gerhypos.2_17]
MSKDAREILSLFPMDVCSASVREPLVNRLENFMVGYVTQQRDLSDSLFNNPLLKGFQTYYYQPSGGAGAEKYVASLISWERTRSWRSGGEFGSQIDDYHQILAANVEQFNWPFDNGHEFDHRKVSELVSSHDDYVVRGYGGCYYRGPLHATDPVSFWTGHNSADGHDRFTLPSPSADITVGTKFLRSTLPGKSQANLSQLILETIRDMPRIPFQSFDHRLFDRRNLPKNIGSEYLNTVFGWAPLVSDVLKACEAIVKIDDIIAQYQRDAGPEKTVRRTRKLDPVRTSSMNVIDIDARLGFPLGPNGLYDGVDLFRDKTGLIPSKPNGQGAARGILTSETETYERYWFVARWMYYLGSDSPVFGELRRIAQLARKTLGIRLDLELLWELAPWTWLSDWFVNIGDVLAVSSAISSDSTVLQYAYLMHETQYAVKYTHSGVLFFGNDSGPITSLVTQRRQERVRATPYGFGVNLGGLSPEQIAILAALVTSGYNGSRL